MDELTLPAPPSPLGSPAPFWLLITLKVAGFTLHTAMMNLWYAGLIIAILMRWRGNEHARQWGARLFSQMPVIVALGINFGIVPLLFTQTAYYRVFYPATILMAWPWFSIVVMLMVAYYGVYIYVSGLRKDRSRMAPLIQAAGWVSALLFIAIGFIFANGFSLMTNLQAWPELWRRTNADGAVTGLALNIADPTLWPRWLMMFGLALTTTAAYVFVDAGLFADRESRDYKRWATRFALKLSTIGALWFWLAAAWYVFGAAPIELRHKILSGSSAVLTAFTAVSPALPWLLLLVRSRGGDATRVWAILVGTAQMGVLALNAVSRQMVQNESVKRFIDGATGPVSTQWIALIVFLLLLGAGIATLGWMLTKTVAAARQSTTHQS